MTPPLSAQGTAGVNPVTRRLDPPEWYDDAGEVHALARWLLNTCQISTVDEVLYLFEKPHKWSVEREQMVAGVCETCDGDGEVAVGFGIYSTMRPAIARCPDCGGSPA